MGNFIDDGIGHTMLAATPLPLSGGSVNFSLAKGVIVPASSASPTPIGAANYTSDYFSFHASGGSVTLTVVDGSENITPGVADPGTTLASSFSILNSAGTPLFTVSDNTNLTESITQTLASGNYYAKITSFGGETSNGNYDPTAQYYDMGSYFLTGSGFTSVPEPAQVFFAVSGGVLLFSRRRRTAA